MKIAHFSTGDKPRYGTVQSPPEDGTVSDESKGYLLVLKRDPFYSLPETTGGVAELGEARLLSPVIPRSKVVGIGKNYGGHIAETGEDKPPRDPVAFLKPNTSVIGPDAPIILFAWSEEAHYEAEFAVVIKILAKDAPMEHVDNIAPGYTVANDVSAHNRQCVEPQWVRAKIFDISCPLRPRIEVPELGRESLFSSGDAIVRARVDDRLIQEGCIANMIHSIPELVTYVSTIFALLLDDVILAGMSVGVDGIRAGQYAKVEAEGIGSFSNPVAYRWIDAAGLIGLESSPRRRWVEFPGCTLRIPPIGECLCCSLVVATRSWGAETGSGALGWVV